MTLAGTNFRTGAQSIKFGGTAGTNVAFVDSTHYTVTTPAHTTGIVDVVMTDVNGRTATDTRTELGTRFDRVAVAGHDWVLTLRSRLAWAHDWVSDPTLTPLFQTLPGASFVVNGAAPAKNSALASAGGELRLASGVALLAKFDGEFAAHASTYAGTGTLRYTW